MGRKRDAILHAFEDIGRLAGADRTPVEHAKRRMNRTARLLFALCLFLITLTLINLGRTPQDLTITPFFVTAAVFAVVALTKDTWRRKYLWVLLGILLLALGIALWMIID